MPRFALSQAARDDVETIAEFTAERWGKGQAQRYLDALQGRLTELAHRPMIGRRRDELAPQLLSFPFESHVIFYVPEAFGISVVRILH